MSKVSPKFCDGEMWPLLVIFLVKNSKKKLTARIFLKKGDEVIWFSLFPAALQAIIEKYNEGISPHESLDLIEITLQP